MADDPSPTLLAALGIVVFESLADGTFRPVGQAPSWFSRLSRDGTFPFLGHILDEAHTFWALQVDGQREWGPCAEVGEDGREFHYLVKALRVQRRPYLVFQKDESVERMREVLQKVRSDALAEAQRRPT